MIGLNKKGVFNGGRIWRRSVDRVKGWFNEREQNRVSHFCFDHVINGPPILWAM